MERMSDFEEKRLRKNITGLMRKVPFSPSFIAVARVTQAHVQSRQCGHMPHHDSIVDERCN